MPTEQTPLLQNRSHDHYDKVYDRFSSRKKMGITLTISLAGLIAPFAAGSFVPTIPQIAEDMNTTGEVINYIVGAYIFIIAVGNLIWAPYAEYYGRQPVYLVSLPLVALGSAITASAQSLTTLTIGRCTQAFGASCVQAVGVATISDIYCIEERGRGIGIFFAAMLLGLPLAPTVGGAIASIASWRAMQLCLVGMGLILTAIVVMYLPETSHPGTRGIDLWLEQKRAEIRSNDNNNNNENDSEDVYIPWRWIWLSPISTLGLLRSPIVSLLVLSSALALMSYYALIIPLAFTLGPAFNINTPAAIGLCFIPAGAGNIVGSSVAGMLADLAVKKGKKQRNGQWHPEDRLRATIPGGLVILPCSLLAFGLSAAFIPGKVGFVVCLVCLFLSGMGTEIVLAPSATYLVDIIRGRGVQAMALNGAFRHVFSAISSAAVLPIVNATGVALAHLIMAACAWLAFGLLLIISLNGNRLRKMADVGFTTY